MPDITDQTCRREERLDAKHLRVIRRSTFSGQVHTLDLAITELEWARHQSGDQLIQDALPSLTNPEREFLLTGTTQEEWDAAVVDEEEDATGYLAATEEVLRRHREERGE